MAPADGVTPAGAKEFMMKFEDCCTKNNNRFKRRKLALLPYQIMLSDFQRSAKLPNGIHCPKIGVYAGKGTSHSWLWFIELFEKFGFFNVLCLDENQVANGALENLNVFAVSGGDTFAIAQGLGEEGASAIRKFMLAGGLYIGACAGSYLPMNSSKSPLNLFNFAKVKIANLTKLLPPAIQLSHKLSTPYGCQYVYHPVREAVNLRASGKPPFFNISSFNAPLYGGPSMIPENPEWILAFYSGFTPKTQFLVDQGIATEVLLGKAAALRVPWGRGFFYLFGPHFEHPGFPIANKILAEIIHYEIGTISSEHVRPLLKPIKSIEGQEASNFIKNIKRELSNARIVAVALELMPLRWQIGSKFYEPQKFRVFLEAIWKHLSILDRKQTIHLRTDQKSEMISTAKKICRLLRELKSAADKSQKTDTTATIILESLQHFSRMFFNLFFLTLFLSAHAQNARTRIDREFIHADCA
ncbi:MAG TPA: hypothetical protein DCY12_02425 [Candidatus Atribacteria bacterium]|nr:hypothetical protein [Candidatus Atribacteria bacterium]